MAVMRCGLPSGYAQVATVVSASVNGTNKQAEETLNGQLKRRAEALTGDEAAMELVQELQDIAVVKETTAHLPPPRCHLCLRTHSSSSLVVATSSYLLPSSFHPLLSLPSPPLCLYKVFRPLPTTPPPLSCISGGIHSLKHRQVLRHLAAAARLYH
jgi:hypothetical protein